MSEELLREMQQLQGQDGFVTDDRYRQLVKKAEKLCRFFRDMHGIMEKACDDLEAVSETTGKNLQEVADSPLLHINVQFE